MSFVDDRYDPSDNERGNRKRELRDEEEWWAERRYRYEKRRPAFDYGVPAERVESVAIAPAPAVNGGHEQLSLEA